ncbi:alpha/beta fold hydrolase [Paenibacillus hexagrammi]|uniref:Alpha/beta hydrolase n=1 Tax=Paenibacillus hexagrammi TaxID=2908839 RepID=A0ABY3SRN0_9BACL|nr:alpha/beta hydrolase [Paenibacillus sp. YPD9-1]UJF35637.1 alpha/beta hydrolase [Paenibacillus sp. YPD9-1]
METHMKKIELNGLLFQYRETGRPSAPPLVALHALGLNAESWDEVASILGGKYRVLALDQRGHGGSVRTDEYSFELMRDDLFHFANAMDLEKFTLMGHSMGGTVSYLFSEAYPRRVERLVVEDTPPPFTGKFFEFPPEPSEPLPFDWKVVPSIIQQLNEPNPEWWDRLSEILTPTLLIGGGDASHVPQEKLLEVSKLIPNCQLITVDGAGHFVHLAKLDAFLNAVKPF